MNNASPPAGPAALSQPGETQPDLDPLDSELARLEQALARIATLAASPVPSPTQPAGDTAEISAILAGRLDAMIARLRAVLDEGGGRGPG